MGKPLMSAIAFLATLSSGCMTVDLNDKFVLEKRSSSEVARQSPSVVTEATIERGLSRVYLPFVRIDNRRLPHDLVIDLYNPKSQDGAPNFEAAIFDSIEMVYPDGQRKLLLAANQSISDRTFAVAKSKPYSDARTQVRFSNAVDNAQSFELKCTGTAISQSGPGVPFQTESRYRYDGKDWYCMAFLQEFGSCGGI